MSSVLPDIAKILVRARERVTFVIRNVCPYTVVFLVLMLPGGLLCCNALGADIVINELHTDPDVKTELVEYVDLHNTSRQAIDLSGWYFCEGIFYTFDEGTTLPAGGYVIMCQNPSDILAKWLEHFRRPEHVVFGPYEGKLDNEGEQIILCSTDGTAVDEVDYQLGFS